jgi:serine/alanine adding enzyme
VQRQIYDGKVFFTNDAMKLVQEIDREKWCQFIYNHPEGNVFQSPEMLDIYKSTTNFEPVLVSVVGRDKDILGVLLASIQREYSGPIGDLTTRSIIWGGPVVKNNDADVMTMLLNEYDNIVGKKVILSQFRNLWDYSDCRCVFSKIGYRYLEHLNFVVDLSVGEERLFANLSSSKRRQIRRSMEKEGVEMVMTTEESNIEELYGILSDYYSKYVKKPLPPLDYFRVLVKVLAEHEMVQVFLVRYSGRIIGGIVCPISENAFKKTMYELYICGSRSYDRLYPSVLSTWAPIEWGADNGIKFFDFMGAGKPNVGYGVREFKSKFGGQLVSNGRFEKIHQPFKYELAKAGLKVRQLF